MAATHKAMEIQKHKQRVAMEIKAVRAQIVAACDRVPDRILRADACQSFEWREVEIEARNRCVTRPDANLTGSLNDLRDVLEWERAALNFLS